jgi:hypothetical protein
MARKHVPKARGFLFSGAHPMRVRRIAVLIDGVFFLKRLPKLVEPHFCTTPQQVVETARLMRKRHVLRLTHAERSWTTLRAGGSITSIGCLTTTPIPSTESSDIPF